MIHIKFPGLFIGISCFLIILASITTIPCQAVAITRYVASGGNCGGASPCYSTIQAAVDASVSGDEIRVATGTYSSTRTGGGIRTVNPMGLMNMRKCVWVSARPLSRWVHCENACRSFRLTRIERFSASAGFL